MLGLLWSFLNPLLVLALYTFVFGVVFRARWPNMGDGRLSDFALVLFCGLIVLNLFGECLSRAPGLVIANPNYVKKVMFPLEILPVVASTAKSYSLKEVYYNSLLPEVAAEELRRVAVAV